MSALEGGYGASVAKAAATRSVSVDATQPVGAPESVTAALHAVQRQEVWVCRPTAMEKFANRSVGDFGWALTTGGRFATPAGSPRQDGSPCLGLHARFWGLGFVRRLRAVFCLPVPKPYTLTYDSQLLHRCTSPPHVNFSPCRMAWVGSHEAALGSGVAG
jgi:hypothetical protein